MARWCILVLVLVSSPLVAHPHVWADARLEAVVASGKVSALRMSLTFDEVFSEMLLMDHAPGATSLDATAERSLASTFVRALAEFEWLVHGSQGARQLPAPEPQGPRVSLADHRLTFSFAVPWSVDLALGPLAVAVYDESFYVDVQWVADPPRVKASGKGRATVGVQPLFQGRALQGGTQAAVLTWIP
jgi:ABC-type uncharacterized transport system substrate-binding protein